MPDIDVRGPEVDHADTVLTAEALAFLGELHARFAGRRDELLARRLARRDEVARRGTLEFLPETAAVREGDWRVAPIPADLQDRRVEITGPTDPKMAINALNSGAKVWLADLEDANTPHWANVVGGQDSLMRATRGTLAYTSPEGKEYALRTDAPTAVVVMRPRGWHLDERHLEFDGRPGVGALVDFGLYFFHNAAELMRRGSGPYFYLPKTESHLEARLWNDVFVFAQDALGIPQGSVRATVLIETIPAAFEMDEILYELRDHAAGLNAGRWDYLFSIIKYFRDSGDHYIVPDRNAVTMAAPFMQAYTDLLVRTCHRRGASAIGGMAAFIPSRRDAAVNETALQKVRADKTRESKQGFDGSWVAHPDLVPICREVFDAVLGDRPNQIDAPRTTREITPEQLLDIPSADAQVTEDGVRNDVSVGLQYLASWLGGNGAVAINNLMEDAATAEISRSQLWQWWNAGVRLPDGTLIDQAYLRSVLDEEFESLRTAYGDAFDESRFLAARRIFETVALADEYADFLTVPAYAEIVEILTP